jgi:RNA polymerase sigma-70 factor (ECF subfamily)
VPTLEEAFRLYAPYVAAVALRILGRPEEVDDLVQDVFIEAHKGIAAVREPRALKGWLATITARIARRQILRRQMWRRLGLVKPVDSLEVASKGASPEEGALLARVYEALERLPADQRIAWALRYLQGERLDQVALTCGCSLATAKRRIAAAHEVVRREVGDG